MIIPPVGSKFGRLLIRSVIIGGGNSKCRCLCDCGTERDFRLSSVVTGASRSCGCYFRETHRASAIALFSTHGQSNSSEYHIWCGMKARCGNQKNPMFKLYGLLGVRVCERWKESFELFLSDVGARPSNGHSIDRFPNKDGNYEPGNVRWATASEQANNRRDNVVLQYAGESMTVTQWAARTGLNRRTIRQRMNAGWSTATILTTPASEVKQRASAARIARAAQARSGK